MTASARGTGGRGPDLTRQIATHLRRTNRHDEAAGLFGHLLLKGSTDPADLDAYVEVAGAAGLDPVEGLSAAAERRPDDHAIRERLTAVLRRRGDDRSLADVASRIADLGGGQPDWLLVLAETAIRMHLDDVTLESCSRVLEQRPGDAAALKLLARTKARARQFDGALQHLDQAAVSEAAPDPTAINLLMAANRRLGRHRRAAVEAADGLGRLLDDGNLAAAARLLRRNGFDAPARALWDRAAGLEPDEARRQRRRMATQLLADGRVSEAVIRFRELWTKSDWLRRLNDRERNRLEAVAAALGTEPALGLTGLAAGDIRLPDHLLFSLLDRAMERPVYRPRGRGVLMVSGALGAGGAERQLVLTATALASVPRCRGQVAVATLQETGRQGGDHLLPDLDQAGVPHFSLASSREYRIRQLPLVLAAAQDLVDLLPPNLAGQLCALTALVFRHRPAVLHGWQDMTGALTALAGLLCGVPRIIIGTRSLAPDRKEGRNRPYLRTLLRRLSASDRVRFCNNSLAGVADYRRWLDLGSLDVAHIPNGFDFGELPGREARTDAAEIVIGGVMRLTEEKRPLLWLDSVLALRRSGHPARGLLIGDGPMRPALEARIAAEGLEGVIELAGRRADMTQQYLRMDLLLLTSRTEGLPNVLIEAQAHGCPVAATPAGGAAETFIDGETGILCPDADAAAIAAGIAPLIEDETLRRDMGRKGAAHAATAFGLPAMLDRTLRLYGLKE